MFSNANVIFRTRFVDGVSNVSRTVPSLAETAMRGAADGHGTPTGYALRNYILLNCKSGSTP